MHARPRTVATLLSAPVALALVAGPLAGAAVADRPTPVVNTISVLPGTFVPVSEETHGNVTVTVFRETSGNTGDFPGTGMTTWTCMNRAGTALSRCTGVSDFEGSYRGVDGSADVRLTATCTESGVFPSLLVSCEGRFRLDGRGALEGLHGQGTFQSSGLFAFSVTGTSELRLHDHR